MNETENNFIKRNFYNFSKDFAYYLLLKELQKIGYNDDSFINNYYAILYECNSTKIIEKFDNYAADNIFGTIYNVIYFDKKFFHYRCLNSILNNDSRLVDCKTKQKTNLYLCKECASNKKPCLVLKINDNDLNNCVSAFKINLKSLDKL